MQKSRYWETWQGRPVTAVILRLPEEVHDKIVQQMEREGLTKIKVGPYLRDQILSAYQGGIENG